MNPENIQPEEDAAQAAEDAARAQTEAAADAELETVFDSAISEEPEEPKAETPKAEEPKAEEPKAETPPPEKPPTETPPTETPPEKPAEKPSYESLEKALKDTQRWAHSLSAEMSEIKKSLTPPAPPPEPEIPENLKEFYEDYPEMKAAVKFEAERLLKERFGDFKPDYVAHIAANIQQMDFERKVVSGAYDSAGKYHEGVPDAYKILSLPEYKAFLEKEMTTNPMIGQISDPVEAISFIGRFKEGYGKAHEEQKSKAAQLRQFASGVPTQGNRATGEAAGHGSELEDVFNEAIK